MTLAKLSGLLILVIAIALPAPHAFALSPSFSTTTAQRDGIAYNWSYYTQGSRENNCLAYALGVTDRWIWPWNGNPNLTQVTTYMSTWGYMPNGIAVRRVYAYGSSSGITHFSKNLSTSSIQVRAKWGQCETFTHSTNSPYRPSPYGPRVFAFSK